MCRTQECPYRIVPTLDAERLIQVVMAAGVPRCIAEPAIIKYDTELSAAIAYRYEETDMEIPISEQRTEPKPRSLGTVKVVRMKRAEKAANKYEDSPLRHLIRRALQ